MRVLWKLNATHAMTCLLMLMTIQIFPETDTASTHGSKRTEQLSDQNDPIPFTPQMWSFYESIAERINDQHTRHLFDNETSIFSGLPIHHVSTFRGNLSFRMRDLYLDGRIPLAMTRVYNSADEDHCSSIGKGWRSLYDEYVIFGDQTLTLFLASGKEVTFTKDLQGEYKPDHREPTLYTTISFLGTNRVEVKKLDGTAKQFVKIGEYFRLELVQDRDDNFVKIFYDGERISEIQNNQNNLVRFEYNSQGKLASIKDKLGRQVNYYYNPAGELTRVCSYTGSEWLFHYNRHRLVLINSPEGRPILQTTYFQDGKVQSIEEENEGSFLYLYGALETKILDVKNISTTYYHNPDGIVVRIQNAEGDSTTIKLNDSNNVMEYYLNGALLAMYSYTLHGLVQSLEIPSGGKYHYEYDKWGQLVSIINPDGSFYQINRNILGNAIQVSSEKGERYIFQRNEMGDIVSFTEASGQEFIFQYDVFGRINGIGRSSGKLLNLMYDESGSLKRIADSNGGVVTCRWDGQTQYITAEKSGNNLLLNRFDQDGHAISSTYSDGAKRSEWSRIQRDRSAYDYFKDGTLDKSLRFDEQGRLTVLDLGEVLIDYTYDRVGRIRGIGKSGMVQSRDEVLSDQSMSKIQLHSVKKSYFTHIDSDELCLPSWKRNSMRLNSIQFEGVNFDQQLNLYRINFPIIEENLWCDYLVKSGLMTAFQGANDNYKGSTSSLLRMASLMGQPPDYRYDTQMSGDTPITCTCWIDQWGNIVECDDVWCEAYYYVPLPPIEPPGEPEPPPCDVIIVGSPERYIKAGNAITFNAAVHPSGTAGPRWRVLKDGVQWYPLPVGSSTNPSMNFTYVFSDSGNYAVVAMKAGCQEPAVVNVCVMKLITEAFAAYPTNRARTKLGVGEQVQVMLSPISASPANCSLTGPGMVQQAGINLWQFDASDSASQSTVTIQCNGCTLSVTFNVVAPNNTSFVLETGYCYYHIQGMAGAGFVARPYILPNDVSFLNIQFREQVAYATGLGYFIFQNGYEHKLGSWIEVTAVTAPYINQSKYPDHVAWGNGHPPFSDGTWWWSIPWEYKVGNGTPKPIATKDQVTTINSSGTTVVSKGGVSVSRVLSDPTCIY